MMTATQKQWSITLSTFLLIGILGMAWIFPASVNMTWEHSKPEMSSYSSPDILTANTNVDIITPLNVNPLTIEYNMGLNHLHDVYNFAGDNITIAILDTGMNASHPLLTRNYGTEYEEPVVTKSISFVESEDEYDYDGHGTFIAGLIAGVYHHIPDTTDPKIHLGGIAPNASIWNLKVMNGTGVGTHDAFYQALDYLLTHHNDVDIVSLSIGFPKDIPELDTKLRQLWDKGILLMTAAGNAGIDEEGYRLFREIYTPGSLIEAITVGASVYDKKTFFSSAGPTSDGVYKPDLVAPGQSLLSLPIHYETNASKYPLASGTSFSAPLVVAGIACVLSGLPNREEYSALRIKKALLATAEEIIESPYPSEVGVGLPNFYQMWRTLYYDLDPAITSVPRELSFPNIFARSHNPLFDVDYMRVTLLFSEHATKGVTFELTDSLRSYLTLKDRPLITEEGHYIIGVDYLSSARTDITGELQIYVNNTLAYSIPITVYSEPDGRTNILNIVFLLVLVFIGLGIGYRILKYFVARRELARKKQMASFTEMPLSKSKVSSIGSLTRNKIVVGNINIGFTKNPTFDFD